MKIAVARRDCGSSSRYTVGRKPRSASRPPVSQPDSGNKGDVFGRVLDHCARVMSYAPWIATYRDPDEFVRQFLKAERAFLIHKLGVAQANGKTPVVFESRQIFVTNGTGRKQISFRLCSYGRGAGKCEEGCSSCIRHTVLFTDLLKLAKR